MDEALRVSGLTKRFGAHAALDDVNLVVRPGEMVALIGASGSGKSTLIRHIAGLLPGTRGEVKVRGHRIQSDGRIARDIRRHRADIGVVFQQFNLVGRLSVLTNVAAGALGRIPTWRAVLGWFTREEQAAAMRALERVGIANKARQRAANLSGGQQQRAAIARTLVQGAEVILADEPIASLDPESSRRVMQTLAQINREDGKTVIVSLHQVDFAVAFCPRTVALRAGRVVYDGPSTGLTPALLKELYGAESEELIGIGTEKDEGREWLPGAAFALAAG